MWCCRGVKQLCSQLWWLRISSCSRCHAVAVAVPSSNAACWGGDSLHAVKKTQQPSNAKRWLQGWPRPFWGGCWWAWEAVLWSAPSFPSHLRTQSKYQVSVDAARQAFMWLGTQPPCHVAGYQALPGK